MHSALFLLLLFFSASLQDDSLSLYSPIPGFACTSLLNKDGRIGCVSSMEGDFGALWLIQTNTDLDEWINKKEPNVLVVSSQLFIKGTINRLVESGYARGILVLAGPPPSSGYSPVSSYPNKQFGLHPESTYQWNPLGDDLAFQKFDIPMFQLDAATSEDIIAKATINKVEGYPKHAASLQSFMTGSTDSETCLRRGRCEPVGGKSIWTSLYGPVNTSREMVMAITHQDSNAFFRDVAVGADADVSGTIAQLLAAVTLKKHIEPHLLSKDIVFAWFAGEAWGYVGSQRFVYDITQFACETPSSNGGCDKPPKNSLDFESIKMPNIDAIIELNQVGNIQSVEGPNDPTLFVHSEPTSNVGHIKNALQSVAVSEGYSINLATDGNGIPPSSLSSFLHVNSTIPGVVISEFDTTFNNKFYHSKFDGPKNMNLSSICIAAKTLAATLYLLARAQPDDAPLSDLQVDCGPNSFAEHVFECLTQDMNCILASAYFTAPESQPSQYTSVFRSKSVTSQSQLFLYDLIYEVTGDNTNVTCSENSDCGDGQLCLRQKCISGFTHLHDAVSLAFDISNDFAPTPYWANSSTWTEPYWRTPNIKLFLIDNPVVEIFAFVFGVVEFFLSVVVVWCLKAQFVKRFKGK